MVTEVKPLQLRKAQESMTVTLFGIVTEVKPLLPEKANIPIDVTLLGMTTEDRLLHIEYLQVVLYQQIVR